MVRTTCTEPCQLSRPLGTCEGQGARFVRIVSDRAPVRGEGSAQRWQDLSDDCLSIPCGGIVKSAEQNSLLCLMPLDEFTHLVNRLNRVQVALALRRAPGEEPVPAENDAVSAGIVSYRTIDKHSKFKPRS